MTPNDPTTDEELAALVLRGAWLRVPEELICEGRRGNTKYATCKAECRLCARRRRLYEPVFGFGYGYHIVNGAMYVSSV